MLTGLFNALKTRPSTFCQSDMRCIDNHIDIAVRNMSFDSPTMDSAFIRITVSGDDIDTRVDSENASSLVATEVKEILRLVDEYSTRFIQTLTSYFDEIGIGNPANGETYSASAWDSAKMFLTGGIKEPVTKQRVFFDMDGVVAIWNEHATVDEVMTKGYFFDREACDVMINLASLMQKNGYDVYILSKSPYNGISDKFCWLAVNMPFINPSHILLVPADADKEDFVPNPQRDDILIDDYEGNFKDKKTGRRVWHGEAIKCLNGINRDNHEYPTVRYDLSPEENLTQIETAVHKRMTKERV